MTFSQSFEFGNSTFMKLESQVNHAIKEDNIAKGKNSLDVIPESPTKSMHKNTILTISRNRSQHLQNTTQRYKDDVALQHRKFRRSKSDSILSKAAIRSSSGIAEDNSQFFKSDISFPQDFMKEKLITEIQIEDTVLRVSQIERIFEDLDNIENTEKENTEGDVENSFEKPIFSEDLEGVLETEEYDNIWKDSLPLSSIDTNDDKNEIPEILHEISNFICLPKDDKILRNHFLNNEMEISHRVFRESQHFQDNVLQRDKSSSCITRDKLKYTQQESSSEMVKQATESNMKNCQIENTIDIYSGEIEYRKTSVKCVNIIENDLKSNENLKAVEIITDNLEALKNIKAWNLPLSVLTEYERKGVKEMFDWQVQCLSNPKVLFEHCNLVYSAPTSAGKTLVSEILLLKTVLERGKKVLLILPFISVVREKMCYLQDLLTVAGYRVEGFFGGYTPPGGFDSINVAICTIEKANSIINKLLEQGRLDEIGTVIVDEVHLISDPGRGYILELLLAKILYMSRKYGLQIQVITMSATLANVDLLKKWLNAELYITDFRPVALQEMIKIGNKIYDNNLKVLRSITEPSVNIKEPFPAVQNDSDHIAQLCFETLIEGCSVVIFCPSKDWCESLAIQLAGTIHSLGKHGGEWGTKLRTQINRQAIDNVKAQLRDIPTGLDIVLEKCITYGCAFHHAGLTTEERDILESSFKSGALKIIVATSTLSSGVNLPARRVLIRSPLFGGKQMSSVTYRQMIGRAGRTGKDILGESILICTESNARIGKELITADLKPICSCLDLDSSTHLKRALLEVISSGVAISKEDIDNFVNCTLLSSQRQLETQEKEQNREETTNSEYISEALNFLIEYEFIHLQSNEETQEQYYMATRLGQACLASSMPPNDGLILFAELQKSKYCFVLESELHAVYLVTPYSVCYQLQDLDWLLFLDLWEKLTPAMKKVGELVGVKESFLVRAMRGQTKLDYKLIQIHKRFYTALALQELVNETPINTVAIKYKCSRGMLQSLQQMASTFAGIVTSFCNSLQWDTLSLIVSQFKERLYFGIHRDLIDLMRLPDLNHKRARALFDAGITSLVELASADILSIEKILYNSLSFDSAKKRDDENDLEAAQRNKARNFFLTGKSGLTVAEAAKILIQEAREFVQYEIGVGNIKWSQNVCVPEEVKNNNKLHMSYEEDKFRNLNIEENENRNHITDSGEIQMGQEMETLSNQYIIRSTKDVKENDFQLKEKVTIRKDLNNKVLQTIINREENIGISEKQFNLEQNKKYIKSIDPKKISMESSYRTETKYSDKSVRENKLYTTKQSTAIKSNESNIKLKDDSKLLKVMDAIEEKSLHKNKVTHENQKGEQTRCLERRYSTDHLNQNICNTYPEVAKMISNIKIKSTENEARVATEVVDVTPNIIRSSTNVCEVDGGPITGKKAQQLLSTKQLSEMKKQEWAEKRDQKEILGNTFIYKKFDNDSNKTNSRKLQNNNRKSHEVLKNTPNNTEAVCYSVKRETQKFLRRSPRNHAVSSAKIQQVAPKTVKNIKNPDKDLFDNENEESFIINTDINEALKEAKNLKRCFIRESKNNSSEDEIPSSQQITEVIPVNKTKSPYASRFLRSSRTTKKIHTESSETKAILEAAMFQKQENIDLSKKSPSSISIELSDFSMENSLIKHPIQLNASHILSCSKVDTESSSFKSIDIIDICGDLQLFKGAFKEFMANKRLGFCLGIQQKYGKRKPIIGANLLLNQPAATEKLNEIRKSYEFKIDDTNYLAGISFCISDNVVYYMNMEPEGTCKGLTGDIKCKYLCMLLRSSDHTLLIFDAKEQMKTLRKILKELEEINVALEDPKIANWLLQPDKIHNLYSLAQQFAPECSSLVNLCGSGRGYNSYGLDSDSAILAKVRSSIEACVTKHILKGQIENLERIGCGQLHKFFVELEMPLQISLCNMENIGFPTSSEALHKLYQQIVDVMKKLETKIYDLHGSRFNLGSSSAVAKVLGLHRKSNGRISTSKQILEKIDSPISQMIITYRKLSVTLTKNIQPLLKCVVNERIHGQSITFTSTGRISMTEPNLQNVAKDFEVTMGLEKVIISCRGAFFPIDAKRCLISSDFCQLEMRILAHLSQDSALLQVMRSEKDVFVAIAARWNKISEKNVTERLRNGTKQICYGIVYGMGMRALAECLKCTEQEAKIVSEQFHAAYPGIRLYTSKIIKFARNNGYIETIAGRRRYLEHISSDEALIKNQAERQAVNSTIQGSAADITKSAILRMEKNIIKYREKLGIEPQSVRLVLHLHDELIFEVPEDKAKKIAKVLSITMENCVKLHVPLKVKLKVGKSWGELKELKL